MWLLSKSERLHRITRRALMAVVAFTQTLLTISDWMPVNSTDQQWLFHLVEAFYKEPKASLMVGTTPLKYPVVWSWRPLGSTASSHSNSVISFQRKRAVSGGWQSDWTGSQSQANWRETLWGSSKNSVAVQPSYLEPTELHWHHNASVVSGSIVHNQISLQGNAWGHVGLPFKRRKDTHSNPFKILLVQVSSSVLLLLQDLSTVCAKKRKTSQE